MKRHDVGRTGDFGGIKDAGSDSETIQFRVSPELVDSEFAIATSFFWIFLNAEFLQMSRANEPQRIRVSRNALGCDRV